MSVGAARPWIAALICALAPIGVNAAQIRYAWTGFIEPGSAPGNPWGLSGDGSALTQGDGTPFSVEVFVDENALDGDTDEPGVAQFVPASATILIGGNAATIVSLEIAFFDDDASSAFDTIQVQGAITLLSTTLFFGAEARLPIGTFAQGPGFVDLPPIFDETTPIQFGGFGGDVLTYPADAPVTATAIPNIPEPSTAALVAVGFCGLAGWSRGSARRGA